MIRKLFILSLFGLFSWIHATYALDLNYWYFENSPLPERRYFHVAIDSSGYTWVTAWDSCIYITDTYNWEHKLQSHLGIPEWAGLYKIHTDKNDNMYVGSDVGLLLFDENNVLTVFDSLNSPLPSAYTNPHLIDKDNSIWMSYNRRNFNNGLANFDGINWSIFDSTNSGLPDFSVYSMNQDLENNIWISTKLGITRFDGNNWDIIFNNHSDSFDSVAYDICVTHDGSIYFATQTGIIHYNDEKLSFINSENSDLPSNYITSIAEDKKNILWIGCDKGLYTYDGVTYSLIHKHPKASNILVDKYNNKWYTTYYSGFYNHGTVYVYNEDGLQGVNGVMMRRNFMLLK